MKKNVLFIVALIGLAGCAKQVTTSSLANYDENKAKALGVPAGNKLSSAMIRAINWPERDNSWFVEFDELQPLKGDLAYEKGVVRRDPSAIIKVDSLYYVWYSKSYGPTQGFAGDLEKDKVFPWDRCDLWYATSVDGWTWKEQGIAVARGEKGAYDDRSVFTPEVMAWKGKYYLYYQTVKSPYSVRVIEEIAVASSDSPRGPWVKSEKPIVSPSFNTGEWKGTADDRFSVNTKGDFDSHKTHDPCVIPYKGKFYLYYKGERMGEEITFAGREIKHGVAISDNPTGPFVKSEYNPISNSGHEVCVWPYNGGIASLITTDSFERNTIQWAPDGINFEIMAAITGAPHAIGLNRTADNEKDPTEILRWGLTHKYVTYDYQCIMRFSSFRKTSHAAKGEKTR